MILTAILTLAQTLALAQQTPAPPLSWAETLRCAGLTQAASELEGGESGEGRALSDAALFWALATAQAGAAAGKSEIEVDREQTAARTLAVRQLTRRDPAAREALAACRARTPDLG